MTADRILRKVEREMRRARWYGEDRCVVRLPNDPEKWEGSIDRARRALSMLGLSSKVAYGGDVGLWYTPFVLLVSW